MAHSELFLGVLLVTGAAFAGGYVARVLRLRLLRRLGAAEVVDAEFESSLEFVRHVLYRFGVDGREITAVLGARRREHYASE